LRGWGRTGIRAFERYFHLDAQSGFSAALSPITRGALLATDSIAIPQPNLPAPKSTVAGASHTIFLLAVIAAWSAWGYFGTLQMRTAENPHRAAMYVLTILWEWTVVAYVAWGVKSHGSSLRELAQNAKSSCDTDSYRLG
jgi:hypothetical protein